MATVIVYGPNGCGKTRNSVYIAIEFGCNGIVDEWDEKSKLTDGFLHLCIEKPKTVRRGVFCLSFDAAMNGCSK